MHLNNSIRVWTSTHKLLALLALCVGVFGLYLFLQRGVEEEGLADRRSTEIDTRRVQQEKERERERAKEREREREMAKENEKGAGVSEDCTERANLAEQRLHSALEEIDRLDPDKAGRKEKFKDIWTNHGWGMQDRSGVGSTIEASAKAREAITKVIKTYNISTMLDAPCGSFTWMPLVDFGGLNVSYVGVDIVPDNIQNARKKYANNTSLAFFEADVVSGYDFHEQIIAQALRDYPESGHDWKEGWDLIFSRDFLQHLPFDGVRRVLINFNNSKSRYLLLTHQAGGNGGDIPYGDYHPMDVLAEPFLFPNPIAQFDDVAQEKLFLYKLPILTPFLHNKKQ